MFGVPWRVMLLNQPDLAWVILISGSLALVNGVLQSIKNGRLGRVAITDRRYGNTDLLHVLTNTASLPTGDP